MNSRTPRRCTLRFLSVLIVGSVLAGSFARAQQAQPAGAPDAATLSRYDKNKNGRLDPEEFAAMQADEARARAVPVQTAPVADEVIQLSPFEVKSGDEKGYAASSSLSGTRLNSRLEDIAGSISVVTKQQLMDMAAVDINDIFLYEVGTEGTGQFTDLTNDGRGDYDNVAGNPTGANRMRGLAQAQIAVGGFSASSSIPIDVYNLESIEISRGPNSNLAGLSDAGGTVNLNTSRANVNRETTNVQARVDSYGGFRTSIDVNRPVIKNVLSLRFSAVYNETGYVRKPSVDRTNRQQLALTFRPFSKTTITGSFERFHQWAQRANSIMPREGLSNWRAGGSPTYDPVTQTFTIAGARQPAVTTLATVPNGIGKFGSANVRNFEFIDAGRVQFLMKAGNPSNNANTPQQMLQSSLPAEARPLWKIPGTTDKSIYDWTDINLAAPNFETNRAKIFNARLEQNLLNTQRHRLDAELGWRREDQQNYRRMFIAQQDGVGNTIMMDVNERLLDGRANPYFLRPYIGGVNPQVNVRPNFNDNLRSQLAYQLDLRREKNILRWLGLHRAVGYGEYRVGIGSPSSLRYHDSVVDSVNFLGTGLTNPTPTTNLTNAAGAMTYPLFYLGSTKGGNVEYANLGATNWTGRIPATYYGGSPAQWNTETVTLDEIYFAMGQQKKKVRTVGGSVQSFWLNGDVVTTIGRRKDRSYTVDSLGLPLVNGFFDLTNLDNFGLNKRWREGKTVTEGVVVKPFRSLPFLQRAEQSGSPWTRYLAQTLRGLNVHANKSNSFQPADTAYNVFLQALPNPTGESQEYGFSLYLFDNRFALRVTHHETTQFHTRSGIGVVATRAMSLDFDVPGQTRTFDLYQAATGWQQTLHPELTLEQAQAAAAKQIGYTVDYITSTSGKSISDVNDAISRGWELELQFNPTRFWTLRATGRQQEAVDQNVSLYIQKLINQRYPIWTTIMDPVNNVRWWTERQGSDGTPEAYFVTNVQTPLNLAITTQGKKKPQTREYNLNLISNFQLAGLGGVAESHRWLRNMSVGGAYRWASKGAIGYQAGLPDSDGVIRSLDKSKPIYDKPTGNLDLTLGYNTRLFNNRIRARFQLNVRNATENGHLQGVAVNPDGQYWQYRIIDPRQFIFTTTFDL